MTTFTSAQVRPGTRRFKVGEPFAMELRDEEGHIIGTDAAGLQERHVGTTVKGARLFIRTTNDMVPEIVREHPRPWWFRLAMRYMPERCREVPEAVNPDRIVLRQVALVKRYLYLQQFASGEDPRFMHSHQWRRTFAFGLHGSYTEHRMAGTPRHHRAPYFYTMDSRVVHHVEEPTAGHTSLFLGLFRDDDLKQYFPTGMGIPWYRHIQKMVKRI